MLGKRNHWDYPKNIFIPADWMLHKGYENEPHDFECQKQILFAKLLLLKSDFVC